MMTPSPAHRLARALSLRAIIGAARNAPLYLMPIKHRARSPISQRARQHFAWDGESWAPAVALGVSQITNANGLDLNLAMVDGDDVWRSTLYLGNYSAQLTSHGDVNVGSVGGGHYSISGPYHSFGADFDGSNVEILRLGLEGDTPTIGFLGAARVSRPSITGSTTGEQIDSLVAALVALGLVSDERPPP
jgi:hypothetical protein